MIKAVIFDMDGTMIDTERLSTGVWFRVAEEKGFEITQQIIDSMRGRTTSRVKEIFREVYGDAVDYDAARALRTHYMNEIMDRDGVPKKKGLMEILTYLKEAGIPAAVATSTRSDAAIDHLKKAGVYEYLSAGVYGDMVTKSKPDPQIFHMAAEALGVDPEECVVVEDSEPGILAAKAAGGYSVFIQDMTKVPEEAREGVSAELEDLAQLIDWIKKINA